MIRYLTRNLHRELVFPGGDKKADITTYRLNQPTGRCSENTILMDTCSNKVTIVNSVPTVPIIIIGKCPALKSFMRQVAIIEAHGFP